MLQVVLSRTFPFQAQQILSTCLEKIDISGTEGYDVFLSQLKDGLKNTSHETAANHKVAKVTPVGVHRLLAPSYQQPATSPGVPRQTGSTLSGAGGGGGGLGARRAAAITSPAVWKEH